MQITEKHVISLRCDRGSSYKAYLAVQNELVAAYNELRDELAQEKWGKDYAALDEDQQKAIRDIYPQKISEAEPKDVYKRQDWNRLFSFLLRGGNYIRLPDKSCWLVGSQYQGQYGLTISFRNCLPLWLRHSSV